MKYKLVCFFSALLTSACGGSGSSDEKQSVPSESSVSSIVEASSSFFVSSGSATQSSVSSSSEQMQSDGTPPIASFTFPRYSFATHAAEVVLKGVASDLSGIQSVRINGILATLIETDDATTFEWEISFPLPDSNIELVLSATDMTGEISKLADSLVFTNPLRVPHSFAYDARENTIVGVAITENWRRVLVSYNFDTGAQLEYGDLPDFVEGPLCYDAVKGYVYYLAGVGEGIYSARQHSLWSGEVKSLYLHDYSTQLDEIGGGYVSTGGVLCGLTSNSLYVFSRLISASGDRPIGSISIDYLDISGVPTLESFYSIQGSLYDSPNISGYQFVSSEDGIIGATSNLLFEVPFVSGVSKTLAFTGIDAPFDLAQGSTSGEAYIANFDGVTRVDVSSEVVEVISKDRIGPLAFDQVRGAALDKANNRLLVSDSSFSALIAVDLDSGERTVALSDGVGAGHKFIGYKPGFAIDEDAEKVYVVGDGSNSGLQVIEVDLNMAQRKLLATIGNQYSQNYRGVELDTEKGILYVVVDNSVVSVSIEAGAVEVIVDNSVGFGTTYQTIEDMAFDSVRNRLLFVDYRDESLLGVDLATLERYTISRDGVRGEGESFVGPNALAVDEVRGVAYTLNQASGKILLVDLKTGNREEFIISCEDAGAQNTFQRISISSDGEFLVISGGYSYTVSINDGECDRIPEILEDRFRGRDRFGNFFSTLQGGLSYYNGETLEGVLISK